MKFLMKKEGFLTKEMCLKLLNTPDVIVDLNKDNDDSD